MRGGSFATVLILCLCLASSGNSTSFQFWLAYLNPFYAIYTAIITGGHAGDRVARPQTQTQLAPALIPFVDGISAEGSAAGGSVFIRDAGGSYVTLQFNPGPPLTLVSPASLETQLFSSGVSTLINTSPTPAGIGIQSQGTGLSSVFPNGLVAFASVNASGVGISLTSGAAAAQVSIGQDVNTVLFADFNNDGNPDLAVAFDGGSGPGGIAILLGESDGTFSSPVVYASGTTATHFAVLDLNHDGVLDIATASLDQSVTVLRGKGDGSFASAGKYSVGGSGQAIAIADFNGDGNPDIVSGAMVLLGNGDGTFRTGSALPAVPGNLWAFAAGDLNGDGKIDVAYADIVNQVVAPLFGNGDGTFRTGQAYAVSALPDFLVLADYNQDGHLDIINGSGDQRGFGISDNSGNTDILVNNGDGTFQGAPAYFPYATAGSSTIVRGMAVGKFGGSVGVVSSVAGGLVLEPGNAKGQLQAPQPVAFSSQIGSILSADFNGDGESDIAVASGSSVAILLANSTGFESPVISSAGVSSISAMTAGDFDGDGKLDLVVMSSGTPGSLTFLKGNGGGAFGTPVSIPAGVTPTSVSAADINGDGMPDIVFADSGSNGAGGAVYVALNRGGGVFQAPVSVFTGSFPAVGIGDINGDGKPDLVATSNVNGGTAVVNWLPGTGNGNFLAPIAIATSPDQDDAVLVQDFNGDGHADIVLAHPNTDVTFFAGNGDGTFSAETHLLAGEQPAFLASADLNGDGKPDLVVGGYTVDVLLNKGTPLVHTLNSASFTSAVAVGSIATVYGTDLATGPAATTTTVTLDDSSGFAQQCTLFYVSPGQVNFLIPASAAAGAAALTVQSGDGTISQGILTLTTTAPGIYAANGLAAALAVTATAAGTQTTTVLVTANPAGNLVTTPISLDPPGNTVYLILYGTGIRGAALSQVSVQIGGQSLAPAYAGAAPGYPGEDQVNVQLPYSLKGSGMTAVTVTVAGQQSNSVMIQIQ
jgi:uncharacterized protein (TIGR03437 family)